jgi:hypothetical protein
VYPAEIEDFDEVELWTEHVVGVVVPRLRLLRTFAPVVIEEHGEADVPAQKRTNCARYLRVEEYVLEEPLLEKDRARCVGSSNALEILIRHSLRDPRGIGRQSTLEVFAGALVDVVGNDTA